MYYDGDRDVYVNEHGKVVTPGDMFPQDSEIEKGGRLSLSNLNVSLATVLQIIAFVVAVVTQYNVLQNKIDDNTNQLGVYKTLTDEKISEITVLRNELKTTHAEISLLNEVVNNLQLRVAIKK
jgi:hypothetical protein